MPSEIEFAVAVAVRKVGPGAVLAEPMCFTEFARLAPRRAHARAVAERNLLAVIPKLNTSELHRRRRETNARALTFALELKPPRASAAWREPIVLKFHAVAWEQTGPALAPNAEPPRLTVARVAELGIEVVVSQDEDLIDALRRDTLAALRRLELSVGLKSLAGVQNTLGFGVDTVTVKARVPTLKDRAIRAEEEENAGKKTILQQVASLLGSDGEKTYEADDTVAELERALTSNPPQSVLLIGPSGVGKTAAVRELARRWKRAAGTPLFATSGSRIVAGQCGFGMWQSRCQDLVKDARKRKAIVHLGPLVELLEVGKSEHNTAGIATFLRPAIGRGELLCVAECTPEQLPLIEKQDPQLLDSFWHVTLTEPDDERGRAILSAFARDNARRPTEPLALAATDRLHRRYATYSAYPGRPLRFLENLIRDGAKGAPITEGETYAAFTRETGLPRPIIDPAVPLNLADTHAWFSSRVIGQPDAVNLVTDLLATVKAGLTRPNRPIASLLFIGPTGVGKTEMAKAVAEFLFGSKDRLTRFDMSEYADPVSVRRLVGGAFGTEGLLTARVREQPFSVLLLDEVEKADPSFFDLLLQALGEARLTDAGGRLADFRNTVVVLTSNLGAESYRRGSTGFVPNAGTAGEAEEHFAKAVEQFLRPEMFNRLDRVVPFAPLGSAVIRGIADREWQKVKHRDGVRYRDLNLTSDPALLDHLASVGFDPRYGARPLKRAMERELLAPLARQMNRYPGDAPLSVQVGVSAGAPSIVVRPLQGEQSKPSREPSGPAAKLASGAQELRRWHQLLAASSVVRDLTNDVYRLGEREKKLLTLQRLKNYKLTGDEHQLLAQLGRLRDLAAEVERQRAAAFALEDEAVVAFHELGAEPTADELEALASANRDWDALLLRLYALSAPAADAVTLALFGENRATLAELAEAYRAAARDNGLTVTHARYDLPPEATQKDAPPKVRELFARPEFTADDAPSTAWHEDKLYTVKPAKLLLLREQMRQPGEGTVALLLRVTGSGAHLRFGSESGVHEIKPHADNDEGRTAVYVRTSADDLPAYRPPDDCVRRNWFKDEPVLREYDLPKATMRDFALERNWQNVFGQLRGKIAEALQATVRAKLLKLIAE
jgi:ATP-dependent Clp protease ATP-binding subunit ClpA